MYFLCMKIHDRNNEIPLMSEHSDDMSALLKMVENTTEMLTRTKKGWDKTVIDNNFDKHHMSNAAIKVMKNEIQEFEWKFYDKYGRLVRCYITRSV